MMENMPFSEEAPAITVDIGRHRLRIHRSTLRRLENPIYVRILVNPIDKGIVVEKCNANTAGSYRLLQSNERKHSMEVYSSSLIDEIADCAGYEQYRSVKLLGRQIRGQTAVFFRMADDSTRVCPS